MNANCAGNNRGSSSRRQFLRAAFIAGAGIAFPAPFVGAAGHGRDERDVPQVNDPHLLKTNIASALAIPRNRLSMPGPYPGVVAEVYHPGAMADGKPNNEAAAEMLSAAMISLTGAKDPRDAWSEFFSPGDSIGIKVNPVGGKLIGTSHAVTSAVIASLESIGVRRDNIVFWDHYDNGLPYAGYTPETYPGIDFHFHHYYFEEDGKKVPKGLDRLDMNVYYEADYSVPDADNEMEYMLTGGTKSYFTRILTEGVDKVICIPSLKHHSVSFTALNFKNLSYGATNNCVRGHFFIDRYIAETCAFPCIRDKVVLSIVDGLRAQYYGGPAAAAKYLWHHNTLFAASDPVALDSTGFDIILEKQIEKGIVRAEERQAIIKKYNYCAIAENLGLGVYRSREIERRSTRLG